MMNYKVGLVGTGVIAPAHINAWRLTIGSTVVGLYDLNRDMAQQRASQFHIPTVYDSMEQLIADCDVVDVCTPPHTHTAIARQVVEAGRHLIIEKPLVIDVRDWDEIQTMLQNSPGKICVIHNQKYLDSVLKAKQWLNEGRIGRLIRIQREFLTGPETDRMIGREHWSHRLPGGRWFETLPHELYLTFHFAGPMEVADILTVATPDAPTGTPAEEVLITLKRDGYLGTMHFSANCLINKRALTLYGTKGIIALDLLSDFAELHTIQDAPLNRAIGRPLLSAGRTILRSIPDRSLYGWHHLRSETPHTRLIQAFGHFLQGSEESPTSMAEIDYVVRNCDLIGRRIDAQLVEMRA